MRDCGAGVRPAFCRHAVAAPAPARRGRVFSETGQGGCASRYYSAPQLRIEAEISRDDRKRSARGVAWLDHEWASTLLEPEATGWDWIGMNLDDGTH